VNKEKSNTVYDTITYHGLNIMNCGG